MSKRSTIREVAQRAGCSVSTVSRVLNGVGRIGAETQAKVREAARELSFRFDPIGQSLRSRQTRTIGVLVPTLANPVFADAIEGVQRAARRAGYQMLLACSNYEPDEETAAVETLIAHRVDGLILTVADVETSPALDLVLDAAAPFVLTFNQPQQPVPAVAVDNLAAARCMAGKMLALGHRQTAFVAGRFRSSDRSRQRHAGFRAAYLAAGAPEPLLIEVDYRARNHRSEIAAALSDRPGLTALFCSNDMLALTVIGDLHALGRAVPGDLSVAGFDGIDIAARMELSLATIATPSAEMGAEAARRLIEDIEKNTEPADLSRLLPHEFRPGRSLGRAPAGIADTRVPAPASVTVPEG